jgi:histone-lysine N-methyltransferase SETMAR
MKIWTCGSSPQRASWKAWTPIKNVNGASPLGNICNFLGAIQTISCRARLVTMEETWLYHYETETKQHSMEWRHSGSPRLQKILSAKTRWKILASLFWHPPHWLSSKGRNYQRGVFLISVGATEGHFEGKTPRKIHQGVLFLYQSASSHQARATQKKLTYLGFQCLDHTPYSLDLAPSDYRLFPALKRQLKLRHFSSDVEAVAAAETWLDGRISEFFFCVPCKS